MAKRAPSLWLKYDYKEAGDILSQDVFVPSAGLAKCTYYCCLNWNSGREGGGYCGIQDHPDGRAYIFSIWDPIEVKDVPITPIHKGPGTWTERFGGEGTGLKSMNFELGWKEDQWYTMVVRRWDVPDKNATRFGGWVQDQASGQWTHLITMEYPVPGVHFSGTTVSFLEDWGFTSQDYRCVQYKGGFKRKLDKSWVPFSKTEFEVNTYDIEDGSATENYNARCANPAEGVCISAGADTECSTGLCCSFDDKNHAGVSQPQKQRIRLKEAELQGNKLTWKCDEGGVPQFKHTICIGGEQVCCGEGENEVCLDEKAMVKVKEGKADVRVEVEDILGNCTSFNV